MNKKNKSKSGKVVSNLDVVNVSLKSRFESVVNLEAETAAYEEAVRMLNAGEISVRGLKATIEAANEKGNLPTIKPSTAQYFALSSKVRALSGGKDKPLKEVLNATIQAKRAFGKDAENVISESKSFAELVKATPSQGERAKVERKSAVPLVNMDAYISLFLGAKELESLYADTSRPEWAEFCKFVTRVIETNAASKNHPTRQRVTA